MVSKGKFDDAMLWGLCWLTAAAYPKEAGSQERIADNLCDLILTGQLGVQYDPDRDGYRIIPSLKAATPRGSA